jgi:hypothetical protein
MCEGKAPKVWMEGEERDYLIATRNGEKKEEELLAEVNRLDESVKEKKQLKILPEQTDLKLLDNWLVSLRMRHLKNTSVILEPSPGTNEQLALKAEQLLSKHEIEGKIFCVSPSGSKAYGTAG